MWFYAKLNSDDWFNGYEMKQLSSSSFTFNYSKTNSKGDERIKVLTNHQLGLPVEEHLSLIRFAIKTEFTR